MAEPINIDAFLDERGFDTTRAAARARRLLEERGLTRAGKQGIAATKLAAADAALDEELMRVCGGECLRLGRERRGGGREAVRVTQASCEVCGGSNNQRAAAAAVSALIAAKVHHVLIVGGTSVMRVELQRLMRHPKLAIKFVEGEQMSHSKKDAIANLQRAELVLIWGSTPLRHAVSNLYTDEPPAGLRMITVRRRGIAALCQEISRSLGQPSKTSGSSGNSRRR